MFGGVASRVGLCVTIDYHFMGHKVRAHKCHVLYVALTHFAALLPTE